MSVLIARKTTPQTNTYVDCHPNERSILSTKHAPLATASRIVKVPQRITPNLSNVPQPLEFQIVRALGKLSYIVQTIHNGSQHNTPSPCTSAKGSGYTILSIVKKGSPVISGTKRSLEKNMLPDTATTTVTSPKNTTKRLPAVLLVLEAFPFLREYANIGSVKIQTIAVDNRERTCNMKRGCCKKIGVSETIGIGGKKKIEREIEMPNIITV